MRIMMSVIICILIDITHATAPLLYCPTFEPIHCRVKGKWHRLEHCTYFPPFPECMYVRVCLCVFFTYWLLFSYIAFDPPLWWRTDNYTHCTWNINYALYIMLKGYNLLLWALVCSRCLIFPCYAFCFQPLAKVLITSYHISWISHLTFPGTRLSQSFPIAAGNHIAEICSRMRHRSPEDALDRSWENRGVAAASSTVYSVSAVDEPFWWWRGMSK